MAPAGRIGEPCRREQGETRMVGACRREAGETGIFGSRRIGRTGETGIVGPRCRDGLSRKRSVASACAGLYHGYEGSVCAVEIIAGRMWTGWDTPVSVGDG